MVCQRVCPEFSTRCSSTETCLELTKTDEGDEPCPTKKAIYFDGFPNVFRSAVIGEPSHTEKCCCLKHGVTNRMSNK